MKHLVILFALVAIGYISIAQKGDYSIEISMPAAAIGLNTTSILKAHVCDNGIAGNDYVANSLRVVISMSNDAEITGISSGSDSHWTLENLTAGSGNTIRLTNTSGTISGGICGDILLNVKGNSIGVASTITSNISFIAAINPLLNNGRGAPNAIQGNVDISNDNSRFLLAVTAASPNTAAGLGVYPNPATDKVFVTGAVSNSDILLYDVNGRLLQSIKATGSSAQEISLTGIVMGNYILRVTGADATQNFKLVKQ